MKFITIILLFPFLLSAQSPDHWETAVYNNLEWQYRIGNDEPLADWMQANFDDSQWLTGTGGIGYGDDDDNTTIANVESIYMRHSFQLSDTSIIDFAILHADFDDAFVAYLNGVEVARSANIGVVGAVPTYNAVLGYDQEASLYLGGLPEEYILSGTDLENVMKEGTNILAIQVRNVGLSSSDLSSNFFFSVGIADGSLTYGAPPNWFVDPFYMLPPFSTDLPLVVINTTTTTMIYDEPKVPAHMGIINNGPGLQNSLDDPYNHYDGKISIEIRGASSQGFDKKNYGFETQLEDGSNNNISLFGMPEENDWILHGPYSDKSLLRNMLAYHMGAATGKYTPRTQLCELVINDDYQGVYVFTERIKRDENRVDMANLKPEDISGDELTGGYLLQIDRDNDQIPNDGWESSLPDFKFFAFDDPDYDEIVFQQYNYIKGFMDDFETDMNSSNYAIRYSDYVDVDSWVDYFLVTEIGKHIDAFKLSFFMHKKKDSNGGKLHFGPLWDFNLAFGNFDFVCSPDPEGWSYRFRGTCDSWHPFWIRRLAEIPNVTHQTNCRWQELREGALHTDSLLQFIDENALLLEEAQVRNFDRWPIMGEYVWPNGYVGTDYPDEINFLKNWLIERLNWMDENMLGDCALYTDVETVSPTIEKISLFPNPTKDAFFVNVFDTNFEELTLELYNGLGSRVATHKIMQPEQRIGVEQFAAGLYWYRILDGNEVLSVGKLSVF
ncbi:MAG: hypothetical protein ACI9VN_000975 [Patescibacteria group bacterium]|jgi:hypothetical protein